MRLTMTKNSCYFLLVRRSCAKSEQIEVLFEKKLHENRFLIGNVCAMVRILPADKGKTESR